MLFAVAIKQVQRIVDGASQRNLGEIEEPPSFFKLRMINLQAVIHLTPLPDAQSLWRRREQTWVAKLPQATRDQTQFRCQLAII